MGHVPGDAEELPFKREQEARFTIPSHLSILIVSVNRNYRFTYC